MIPDPLGEALDHLRRGELLAYPTETVWGIAADATSDAAVERLREFKGRSDAAPVAILVERLADLDALEVETPPAARRLAQTFWPGPLTLVLPCRRRFARGVARDDGAVGVRCSSHPLAAALARRARNEGVGPLTATSLNRSGEPPARNIEEARALCAAPDGPLLIPVLGAEAGNDAVSSVVDATCGPPRVLRRGALKREELDAVLPETGRR